MPGKALHYNTKFWGPPTLPPIYGGGVGVMYEYIGGTWTALNSPSSPTGFGFRGCAVDASNGDVYVSDSSTNTIYRKPATSNIFSSFATGFSNLRNIDIDDSTGEIWAVGGNLLYRVSTSGTLTPYYTNPGGNLYSVAYDSLNGDIYVGEFASSPHNIFKQTGGSGSFVSIQTDVRAVYGLSIDETNKDLYYATNGASGNLFKRTSSGVVTTIGVTASYTDCSFDRPSGVVCIVASFPPSYSNGEIAIIKKGQTSFTVIENTRDNFCAEIKTF